ncbi:hypothetical protein F4819DRAFT_501317 [Hypoxylon fuscum]|nr:hypothetical protein F4819DRAFT_501317 [Hypoxylon fuscum]
MPLALEGFARNIGKEAAPQVYRDIMRFVYKHRREITNCFQHSVETQKEETTDARAESTIPLNEKIQHWLPEVEDSNEPISESEILYDGTWDEESDHDDDPPPVLETYHQIVTHSSAYLWLQSILQREILFHIPRIAYMGNISKAVFSHEIFRRISRRARPPSCDIKYLVDWNPFAFFHSQDYGTTPSEALESVLTHTGNGDEVEAVVCGDYIRRIWPQSGQAFLDLFRSILASNQGTWCNVTMTDGTRVAVSIQTSGVVLIASGQPDTVVEIGEQLAWISSALHPCERTGVTHSIPLIRNVTQTSQTESFVSIKIELSCVLEQNTQTRDEKGNCWQTLFDNPVIVQGYPIRRRRLQQTGLEMSIDVMATLVGTQKITTFNRNIFVKGFSAMLIAVKCVEDMVVWHAVSNDDGAYIYYHDQRLLSIDIQLEGPIPYSDWRHLMDARHIVGWCTKVTSYVGLSNASFLITKSNLGGPGVGFAFEKVTIGGGRYIPASTTIAIGNREKPPRSKTGDTYFGQLRMLASKFIVLYDVDEHRAWLVDGASALLHLLRMSLLIDERNGLKLLNTHLNIQDEARPTEKSRSLAVLQNNMNLKLLENPQDSCQETKITLKSGKEERTITHKKTWVLLKDRVNEIYSTLEEIINYQSDVSSQNGVGCRIRASPRRRLEGFDFLDVAAGGESWPKVATLKPTGKGWVDLVRELKAVTLFGRGFGDLISPSREVNIPVDNEGINTPGISTVCPAWAQVPIGKDYLSTSTTIIKDLVGNDIGRGDARPWQVSNNIYLHSPDKSFEACGCTKTDPKTRCDRVQVLIPRSFLGTRGFRDPVEGETDMEEQDPAFNDSGVETGTASTASMAPSSSHLHSSSADAKIGSNIAMLAPRGRRAAARENLKKTFKNLVKRRSGQNT